MLKFRQLPPDTALKNHLRGYWLIEADALPTMLDLVPDGYPEIFFTLEKTAQGKIGEHHSAQFPAAGFIGQLTGCFAVEVPPFSKVLYVKLYPWTPHTLFHIPAWHLNDQTLELEALTGSSDFRALASRICSSGDFDEMKLLLDDFFLKKLMGAPIKNPFLQFAVHQIFDSTGKVQLGDLTARTHASRRYVEKVFKQQIGLSPKQYARLIRVKKASMYLLDANFKGNIGAIATSLAYFDQSHFLKDFKAVVGKSPTSFLQAQSDFPLDRIEAYLGQWDYS
jgi:AraC-like DNA-binding protein